MRSFIKILTTLIIVVFTVGCSAEKRAKRLQDKIAVEAVENISGSMSSGWTVTLRIRNNTGYAPTLTAAMGELYCDNALTVNAALTAPVTIPKKKTCIVDIPLSIKIANPLKAISMMLRLKNSNYDNIDIAFNADIEVLGIKRSFGTERTDAKSLIEQFEKLTN